MRSVLMLLLLAATMAPVYADDPPPVFVESAIQTAPPPPADKAQIILLEPINKIQGLFPIGIYTLSGEERTLVGVSSWRSKTIVNLAPGHHMLMATQGFPLAHLMEADVQAGKRYYVLLRFVYAQGFQLRPLHTSGTSDFRVNVPGFAEWQSTTRFIEMTPAANNLFTEERWKKKTDKGQAKALENWKAKTDAERLELTLSPADAVPL